MLKAKEKQKNLDVPPFLVWVGCFTAELPLELARAYGRWINGAQLLAADNAFIDNMYGMSVVVDLMIAEQIGKRKNAIPKVELVRDRLKREGFCAAWGTGSETSEHLDVSFKCLVKMRECIGVDELNPLDFLLKLQDTPHLDVVKLVDEDLTLEPEFKERKWEHGAFMPKKDRTMLRTFVKNDEATYYQSVFLLMYAQWLKTGICTSGR